jgi:A/G-specific adenine glycosylase
MVTANASARLIKHYVDNFRRLPWRSAPGETAPDPYRVWLSEVMLQQTTVAAVVPRFRRFVARWPTIVALAAAKDEEILSEWAGLGYYARARNLIACARELSRRGEFPRTAAELRALPGLGDYTAPAIAAIAFGEHAAVVDTNVGRVIARFHALETPSKRQLRDLTLALTPADRPGDFAQAMMDLGATLCRPNSPLCGQCPLVGECRAFASGKPGAYPAAKAKRPRPERYGVAYWIEHDHDIWLMRRPARGLLGGMAALPGPEWSDEVPVAKTPPIGTIRHVFTHFALELRIERAPEPIGEGWWQPLAGLADAGLPTLYRRAAELALSAKNETRAAA